MTATTFAAIFLIGALAFAYGLARARSFPRVVDGLPPHSRPSYHGSFLFFSAVIPALLVVFVWLVFQDAVIERIVLAGLPEAMTGNLSPGRRDLLLQEIRSLSRGNAFTEPAPEIQAAAEQYARLRGIAGWAMLAVVLALMAGIFLALRNRLAPRFRARTAVERILSGLMVACSTIAIVTTLGIVVSLLFEALRFFERVPPSEFFFGLNWEPQIPLREDQVAALGAFGAVPVFLGTIVIATIAMLVAAPIGFLSAIYLYEFASDRVRGIVKPILEILAGVPTIVYGFFAILVVAPALRDAGSLFGLAISSNSALAAGSVMGIMIIPFISSLSDDALAAVPRAMRDGSLALGATRGETIRKVLVPSALPGIMGGILLAVSRAIGETMIVVMAAGLIATLTINPFDSVTTVTVQIVTLLIGDSEFDNPKTLSAFALGLVLFVVTLILNVIALKIVQRFREQYE